MRRLAPASVAAVGTGWKPRYAPALPWQCAFRGLAVASVSAFFAIWGLMRVLERFSSWPFVIYRFALGVIILAGTMVGWLS
jgi:undecaprenyl-diphosphatase